MELNEDVEMKLNSSFRTNTRKNNTHKARPDILKHKRQRDEKDNNIYFDNYSRNNYFSDNNKHDQFICPINFDYFEDNDMSCEYDHSIKSSSSKEESLSTKSSHSNQMISQLKRDLCPNF